MNLDERIALWESFPAPAVDETDGFVEMLISERYTLLQTLAKERDEFGKRETELIKERDAFEGGVGKGKKRTGLHGIDGPITDSEMWTRRSNILRKDLDEAKAEVIRWRGIAEQLIKEARLIKAYFADQWEIVLHKNDVRPLIEAISAYDEAVKG